MSQSNYRATFILFVVLLVTGIVSAQDTTAVAVQLDWIHTIEYSGFYLAEDAGYYTDENLSIELREGGFDAGGNFISSISEVTSGAADFGLTGVDDLLAARANGAPLVAIGVIYQRNPMVFMSLAENEIVQPEDLIGKTVSITAPGLNFIAMMNFLDIDLEEIDVVFRQDFSNDPLINGDVDVLDAFVTNQPVALELEGYELNLIFPSDYAIDIYTNVIFTTEEMIENQPDAVERFLQATLQGLQDAINDPQLAAELTSSISGDNTLSLEFHVESMHRSLPLLNPMNSQPGVMDQDAWEFAHEILLEEDILNEAVDVDTAYTLEFLDAIYGD